MDKNNSKIKISDTAYSVNNAISRIIFQGADYTVSKRTE